MADQLAHYLRETLARELPHLRALPETASSAPPSKPGGWTPKQELGHCIDSAVNNHQRFVRATLHGPYEGPGYAQDDWVTLHAYANMPWLDIVNLWHSYNTFLAHLIDQIPDARLDTPCRIGAYEEQTLGFTIDDYVLHMQHHIDHVLSRDPVTQYPR